MTKYCNKCNTELEEDGVFCPQCGSKDIREEQEEQTTTEEKEETKVEEKTVEETKEEVTEEKEETPVEEKTAEETKEEVTEEKEETPVEEKSTEVIPTTPETTPETVPETTPETVPETTPETPVADTAVGDTSTTIANSNPISIPNAVQAFDHSVQSAPINQNENSFANVPDFMYGKEEAPVEEIKPVRMKRPEINNNMAQPMPMPMNRTVRKKEKTNIPIYAAIGVAAFMILVGIVFFVTSNNKEDILEPVPVAPFSESDLAVNGTTPNNDNENQTFYTKDNSFRVGDKDFGFISIPKSWTYFTDKENPTASLQYTDNGTWIVTLFGKPTTQETAVDWANSVYLTISQSGAQNITTSHSVIDGYAALSISAYYQSEGKYLTTWFLETKNGITHYLAIEGPQASNENYNIIYSFDENK